MGCVCVCVCDVGVLYSQTTNSWFYVGLHAITDDSYFVLHRVRISTRKWRPLPAVKACVNRIGKKANISQINDYSEPTPVENYRLSVYATVGHPSSCYVKT